MSILKIFQSFLQFCSFIVIFTVALEIAANESSKNERTPRIVSGKVADAHEFPFIVSIGWKPAKSPICGGSIYNELTIITAAHCVMDATDPPFSLIHFILRPAPVYKVQSPKDFIVVAGEHVLNKWEGTEQFVNVAKIIVHPSYNGNKEAFDIAVMILSKPLKFNEFVKPIGLETKNYLPPGYGTILGWGEETRSGQKSNVLRKGSVPLIPELVCKLSYGDFRILSNICAGGTTQDTCFGDSGGPLICRDPPVLCGITSYGAGCGKLLRPGAYTKVAYFQDWIVKNCAEVVVEGEAISQSTSTVNILIESPSINSNSSSKVKL